MRVGVSGSLYADIVTKRPRPNNPSRNFKKKVKPLNLRSAFAESQAQEWVDVLKA